MTTHDIDNHANKLYTHYCEKVGNRAYDGKPLPTWREFRADPTKDKQSSAWFSVAELSLQTLDNFFTEETSEREPIERDPNIPRYLPTVLLDMMNQVHGDHGAFYNVLKSTRDSALYAAPEDMITWWNQTASLLQEEFTNPSKLEPWQQKVVDIFMDKKA